MLDRETFLALWIVIFALLGVYMLGKIRFPHDDEHAKVSVPRFFMALISLAFAIYMVPGLWGAPLKAACLSWEGSSCCPMFVHSMLFRKYATSRKRKDKGHEPIRLKNFNLNNKKI